jgi:hypothetical protein
MDSSDCNRIAKNNFNPIFKKISEINVCNWLSHMPCKQTRIACGASGGCWIIPVQEKNIELFCNYT